MVDSSIYMLILHDGTGEWQFYNETERYDTKLKAPCEKFRQVFYVLYVNLEELQKKSFPTGMKGVIYFLPRLIIKLHCGEGNVLLNPYSTGLKKSS